MERMPMSPVDSILGIRDLLIDRVERGREIHVWARPSKRLDCNRYFCHRFAGIRPRRRATEAYRLEVFEAHDGRSEEHTSELQSLMRISYAVFCLKKKNNIIN